MKKARYIPFFAVLLMFFALATVVRADDSVALPDQSQLSAASDAPVILPTNPFYFAKEFARGVRLFFTFGKVNKADYALEVADQKALEVKELEKIDPNNTEGIKQALDNYENNITDLRLRIESIQATKAADPRVGKLLDTLTDQAVRHAELFQDLKANDAVKASVDQAESAVTATVSAAASKLAAPEDAGVRIEKVLQANVSQPVIETAASIVTQTIEAAPAAVATPLARPTDTVPTVIVAPEQIQTAVTVQVQAAPSKSITLPSLR